MNELEAEKELISIAPTREERTPSEWIPRPPEKYSLVGHRVPVNRVLFHPIFTVIIFASADHYAENGVEEEAIDRSPMTDQAIFFGESRDPF